MNEDETHQVRAGASALPARLGLIFAIILAVLMMAQATHAEVFTRRVPAGQSTVVGQRVTYDTLTCASGRLPRPRVSKMPLHGKVSIQNTTGKLGKSAGLCSGHEVRALMLVYTPSGYFHGVDTFTVDFHSIGNGKEGDHLTKDTYRITLGH